MKKFVCLLLPFLFLSSMAVAQGPYGNEWINYSQSYYKFKVAKNGIYRIYYNDLVNAGINLGSVNAKYIQLFNLGEEQYLYINGEADGRMDPGDYIEFIGKANTGQTDTKLYRTPAEQPHPYFSLYTDTAVYFLTWNSSTPGKRVTLFNDTAYTGRTAESYFMHTVNTVYTNTFYDGVPILDYGSLSEYSDAEGWMDGIFKRGQGKLYDVPTPFKFSAGPNPSVTCLWFGRSDVELPAGQLYNHHMIVSVSANNTVYRQLTDTLYKGYLTHRRTFPLTVSDLGTLTTRFQFFCKNDLGLIADNQCVGGIFLTYARQYTLNNTSSFSFSLEGYQTGTSSFVTFSNYASAKSAPIVYDHTNHIRIGARLNTGTLQFIVPNAGSSKEIIIADSTDIIPAGTPQAVTFQNYNFSNGYDYLIITHATLMAGASDYAAYRTSTGYHPLIVTSNQLYDQFYFGLHHPLALRNFCNYALQNTTTEIKYMLLLGKGQLHYLVRTDTIGFAYDLVPTYGNPGSDYMFTSGLKGTNLEPAIATGRVPAITNTDISNYLDKIKEYETTPSQLWQKNVLHLAGGREMSENNLFVAYLNAYKLLIEKPMVGGSVKTYSKDQAVSVSTGLKSYIQNDLNNGLGMLTYIGHGASDILEIDFGGPEELNNKGKYPMMLFSGCVLGNSFTKSSLGERFVLAKDRGTVAWIANSGYGFTSELDAFTSRFYESVSYKKYGQGVGDIIKQTIHDYQDPTGTNIFNLIHSRQFAYEGDPALRLYFKSTPDYSISNAFITPAETNALSDSFAVAVVIKNTGKALNDSFTVTLKRTLPDQSVISLPSIRKVSTFNTDTLYFRIKSKDLKTKGLNVFAIAVDALNEITESNELNNTFALQYFMPSEGAQIISPVKYSIVSSLPVSLRAQASTVSNQASSFIFEIDTNANFNSPFKITSPVVSSNFIASWSPSITPADSTVLYWRVKLLNGNTNEVWENTSFIFISNAPNGWAQKHTQQFSGITFNNAYFDTLQRAFNFVRKTSTFYSVTTYGQNGPSTRTFNVNYWPTRYVSIGDGIAIIAYNPDNESRYNYNSMFNPVAQVPYPFNPGMGVISNIRSGSFWFNTNNVGNPNYQAIRDSLRNHIYNIPKGYHIYVHNGRNTGIENWDTALINAFKSIGAVKITSVREGWPYYLITRQARSAADPVLEETADTVSGIAGSPYLQKLEKFTQLYPLVTDGEIMSEWIGQANRWHTSYIWNSGIDNARDSISYDIIGRTPNQQEVVLYNNLHADSFDLSAVSATTYPFLRIRMRYTDDSLRTMSQLKHWIVTYDELPEGSVNSNYKYFFYKDTLQEGDSIRISIGFQNISSTGMDSIDVVVKMLDRYNKEEILTTQKLKPLPAGDSLYFSGVFSTVGRGGQNRIQVIFNPGKQPELSYNNNVFQKNVFIIHDAINPLLDVTFDGQHINNNEIVQPSPHILITAVDENKIRFMKDTSSFKITLRYPDGVSHAVAFNSPEVVFTPADSVKRKATVEYNPAALPDGVYTLTVNAYDASGNAAGSADYAVSFQVIHKASITHFYPYPNPVSSAMRFVFTITGEQPPSDIKIQISTVSGKVVKTITKEALGPLHIGTNITDVVWNGTDEFGDKLANGVYLYRVIISDKKNTYTLRETEGDATFNSKSDDINKAYGKIYLLR